MENITTVPQAYIQQKDHKAPDPITGLPKTRFICNAATTYNQRLADLANDNMRALIESDKTDEMSSTEDFVSHEEVLNKKK